MLSKFSNASCVTGQPSRWQAATQSLKSGSGAATSLSNQALSNQALFNPQTSGNPYFRSSTASARVSNRATGDSLSNPRNIGTLKDSRRLEGAVSESNRFDFYQFKIKGTQEVSVRLTQLQSDVDVDVDLIADRNKNGRVEAGEILNQSIENGLRPDGFREVLKTGTYAIRVRQFSGRSNYTLDLFAEEITDTSGNGRPIPYGLVNAAAAVRTAIKGGAAFRPVDNLGGVDEGADLVKAPEVWQQGFTGKDVVVAVLDTGVDYNHADLSKNMWRNQGEIAGNGIDDDRNGYVDDTRGWDFTANNNNPIDRNGHGTHVAGTIAAEKNRLGGTGIAHNATIMPVKVLGDDGFGGSSSIVQGIRYAVNNGADVINLSLGSPQLSPAERAAVRYAVEQGAVVVMAAGNDGATSPSFPARFAKDNGIAVGAVNRNLRLADFSNRAGNVDQYVLAPGVQIFSTSPGNTYKRLDGTSMAAPHVAGVAALMLGANPKLKPEQVEDILINTLTINGVRV